MAIAVLMLTNEAEVVIYV